jgi:hypothetical protein
LELILLEFIGLVESALELLLVGLVLLLLEILFGLNIGNWSGAGIGRG